MTLRVRRLAAALSVVLLGTLYGCRGVPSASKTTPVILISVDTLRSDHLPAYGYNGVATPEIDALRADSILYQRAYSHVPLTFPSHATILTGMLPADTGVRDNVGFLLPPNVPTIAEMLKKNGYATGGAVSAFVLRHETGIARGFDFYDDEVEPLGSDQTIGRVQRNGAETIQALEKWIDTQSDKPVFAFLHLYEPHSPYTPPEPYLSRYPNHYDGEIAYTDRLIGEFTGYLKQKGIYDRALIIFLSDHGEGLNEHGEEEHGIFVYREDLQVPLIVKLPKQRKAGATVTAPVELVDVVPTILERTATQVAANPKRIGESLIAQLGTAPPREIYAESYYPRFHFGWSDVHSLISGHDHFIRAPQPELYDLASDFGEKKNIIADSRRQYVNMRTAIESFIKEPGAPSAIDAEDAAKLAALGYVGSTAASRPGQQLPDPKTTINVFRDIRLAFTWYRNGKEDEALRLTNKLLADNSQITDLWDLKFKILGKMERPREAVEAAKDGLRAVSSSSELLFDVASGAVVINDLDTAQQHAELLAKIDPGRAHEVLARIWMRRGNVDKSAEEAKLAIGTLHDPIGPLIELANAERQRGNLQAALGYVNQAMERASRKPEPVQDLHLARGDILARMGRNDEAEKDFRAEITMFPRAPKAYSSLILLLSAIGRTDEATKLVYDVVQKTPGPDSYVTISETLKSIGDDRGALYWAYQGLQKYPGNPDLQKLAKLARG